MTECRVLHLIIDILAGMVTGGIVGLFVMAFWIKREISKGKPPFGITVIEHDKENDQEKPRP